MGLRGIIKQVDIDTNHFLGNHPPFASLDGLCLTNGFPSDVSAIDGLSWSPILAESPLKPGSQNLFAVTSDQTWTHVRLNIIPDGGVARLRVYGVVVPDWSKLKPGELVDLAAVENGGVPLACSDMFFSSMNNLIMPGRSENMGDGWETKRRRGPGYDWIVLKLGLAGTIRKIEVDTNHFKGNYPDMCSIDGCTAPGASPDDLISKDAGWAEILPKTKLQAHTRHFFERELSSIDNCTHVRLNIYPDGGVSRLGSGPCLSETQRMSDFDLLVRGEQDIGISEGKFVALGKNLSGSAHEEIDAHGLTIFPGVIDAHVHFNEPGRTDWEGFCTGSRAAAARRNDDGFRNAAQCTTTDDRRVEFRSETCRGGERIARRLRALGRTRAWQSRSIGSTPRSWRRRFEGIHVRQRDRRLSSRR